MNKFIKITLQVLFYFVVIILVNSCLAEKKSCPWLLSLHFHAVANSINMQN